MSFNKFADAKVVQPSIKSAEWYNIQRQALAASNVKLSEKVISSYSPEDYLLSHCTIIASVDVEEKPVNSQKWAYVITPETAKYINNNNDAWERKLLLGCYKTFVGGENYVEHIQIPQLSKGKIVDAVARDIGESVYVDILVATSKKFNDLINKIKTGGMNTLSMGCQVEYTICTKCGSVAEDEVQLCPCIRYEKGNTFIDKLGAPRIIAELCGHFKDPNSCKFIEASWVKNPAFAGAVLRNILTPSQAGQVGDQLKTAVDMALKEISKTGTQRVASRKLFISLSAIASILKKAAPEDEKAPAEETEDKGPPDDEEKAEADKGDDEKEAPPPETAEPASPPPAPIQQVEQELSQKLLDNISVKLQKQMGILEEEEPTPTPDQMDHNDLLVKSNVPSFNDFYPRFAKRYPKADVAYFKNIFSGIKILLTTAEIQNYQDIKGNYSPELLADLKDFAGKMQKAGYTAHQALDVLCFVDQNFKIKTHGALGVDGYTTIEKLGGTQKFIHQQAYRVACELKLGRKITRDEADGLILKGQMYSYFKHDSDISTR